MDQQKKPTYKYCIVPECRNTIRNAPDKVFFHVPRHAEIRKKWCKIMKRNMVSPSTCLYCCEDHFNIEKDTRNYIKYKIMTLEHGQKVSLLLKKGVVPHIFHKEDKSKLPPERKDALKRQRQALVAEALAEAALHEASPRVPNYTDTEFNRPEIKMNTVNTIKKIFHVDKSLIQSKGGNLTAKKNSVALCQFSIPSRNISTSPLKSAESSTTRKLFTDKPAAIVSIIKVNSHSSSSPVYKPVHRSDSSWHIKKGTDDDLRFKKKMHSGTSIALEREPNLILGL